MKKRSLIFFLTALVFCFLLVFAGCNSGNGNDSESENGGNGSGSTETNPPDSSGSQEKPDEGQKILVAYFSATGTTERVAGNIQSRLGADIYEITPAVPYSAADLNYGNDSCRANREQNDPSARPEINGRQENIEQYEVVFLGYPIWWGQAPKIIYTFLESYDFGFEGVTIIPFCTSGSSPIGSSATNLHSSAPKANWKSGARISGNDVSSLIEQMK